MLIFKEKEEIERYYNENTNTYEFVENGKYLEIKFEFDLEINSNISAGDIVAWDIKARGVNAGNINALDIDALDINAGNIEALDIKAGNINYRAVCFAYNDIECESIKGRRGNCKHFCLDGEIIIKPKKHVKKIDNKEIELSEESFKELKKQLGDG